MNTSRIQRAVGTGSYVVRIAGVSQDHVPVCITSKITRDKNDMGLGLVSKLTWLCGWSRYIWFWCGGSKITSFQCRDRNCLGFVWGSKITWFIVWIEINLFFVSGVSKLTRFRVGIEIDLASGLGSKLTCFQCGGSNDSVFVWVVEINLFFVCGPQIIWF